MNAFETWFKSAYKDNPQGGAEYIMYCIFHGPKDSVAWDYLKQTKETAYTKETFLKAANLILDKEIK